MGLTDLDQILHRHRILGPGTDKVKNPVRVLTVLELRYFEKVKKRILRFYPFFSPNALVLETHTSDDLGTGGDWGLSGSVTMPVIFIFSDLLV